MAEKRGGNNTYANVASTTAAVAALANLLRNPRAAQAAGVTFPPEVLELLAVMATDLNNIDMVRLADILDAIRNITITAQGYPPNADTVTATRVELTVVNRGFRMPEMLVPEGMFLQVKSWPNNPAPPGGLLFVADSEANVINPNSSVPLIPNEFRNYQIKNANVLWVSATAIPAWVVCSVEKRT